MRFLLLSLSTIFFNVHAGQPENDYNPFAEIELPPPYSRTDTLKEARPLVQDAFGQAIPQGKMEHDRKHYESEKLPPTAARLAAFGLNHPLVINTYSTYLVQILNIN
jgi:hypothetical protein